MRVDDEQKLIKRAHAAADFIADFMILALAIAPIAYFTAVGGLGVGFVVFVLEFAGYNVGVMRAMKRLKK